MVAEKKPRLHFKHVPLETVIPLSTPFVVFIDPSSACNFQCKFCPTGDRELIRKNGRFQGPMDFELYKKVIDDLQEFDGPIKVLRLYKDGEPLLNKHFGDMVRYAKQSNRVPYVDTTSNGVYLTHEKSLEIVEAGLDRINISVDGLSDDDFVRYTRTKVNFQSFVDNIRFLYEHKKNLEIFIKMPSDFMSDVDKDFFFKTFENICDSISLENFSPCWPEFDVMQRMDVKMEKGLFGNEIRDVNTCPYIFYSLSVNSDGGVSLCFLDWSRQLLVGDVRQQSLRSIWDGPEMHAHRIAHLQGRRCENDVCASCGQLSHCLADNIDPFVKELEEKVRAKRSAG